MPVPAAITDLNVSEALNSPPGSETLGANMDNYIRALSAFIAQMRSGTVAAAGNLPMGGFKHTGAGIATASGQYLTYAQAAALLDDLTVTNALTAGAFKTQSGVQAAAVDLTVYTIFTAPTLTNGTYIVSCGLLAGNPTGYSAVSLVSVDQATLRATPLQTATGMAISVSGQNIRAAQNSGSTQSFYWTVTRVS